MDTVDPRTRSRMMAGIRGRDTTPERVVRSFLHRSGLRFRVYDSSLPCRPDIVLRRFNVVVFVHGCFWHLHSGCPNCKFPGGSLVRREFWRKKLTANRARDLRCVNELVASGWRVAVVWECVTRNPLRHRGALPKLVRWIRGGRTLLELP